MIFKNYERTPYVRFIAVCALIGEEVMVCWFLYLHLRKKALQLSLKFIFSLPSLFLILKVYISNFLPLVICFYLLKDLFQEEDAGGVTFPLFFFFFTLGIFLLFPQRREGERNNESVSALSAGEY
jgi:hypothetical protein